MANEVTIHVKAKDDASKTISTVGQHAKTAASHIQTMGQAGVKTSKMAVAGFAAMGGAATVVGGKILDLVTAPVRFGLEVAAANEQAKISFTTMLGSAKKADAFLVKLKDFAAKTPFEFPELQTAASALISVGINAHKVIPIMTTLGNVTSGMGTGSEGVKRATIALQQMSAAGRITAEDLNQLRDAGIPLNMVFKAIGEQTGQSTKKLMELYQTGKLGKKEFEALMKSLASGKGFERFNGLMDQQSKSLTGMISTLKDTFGQGMANALEGAIPFIKGAINRLTIAMGKFFKWTQSHQDDLAQGFINAGNAILGLGIAFSDMAVIALRSIGKLGDMWDGLDMFQQATLKKLGFDGSAFSAFGKSANGAADEIEGMGGKLKAAKKQWDKFGKETKKKLLIAEFKGEKKDLDAKLASARKQLKDPNLTKERKAKLTAEIAKLLAAKKRAQAAIDALHGKTVKLGAYWTGSKAVARARAAIGHGLTPFATGGIAHAAEGGNRGNQVLVGEEGPEIVDLPMGSHVNSNPDSQRIAGGGKSGGGVHFHFHGPVYGDHNALKRALVNMKRAGDLDLVLR